MLHWARSNPTRSEPGRLWSLSGDLVDECEIAYPTTLASSVLKAPIMLSEDEMAELATQSYRTSHVQQTKKCASLSHRH